MADPVPRRLATTRWTLIRAARVPGSPEADAALASLCEIYWYPVYAFIRRSGSSPDDARDLTQAFFTRVIEKNYFGDAREERGRFRSFLLTAVRHFLSNERDAAHALKRGGGQLPISLQMDDGERVYAIEPVEHETPERTYERKWAHEVMAQAMKAVESRYAASDRRPVFLALRPFLTGDNPGSFGDLATTLGTTEGALRVAAHRLRQQFASALRETIAETVERSEDVDDELRHLLGAVSS
jgi:DNA-directed RNA polymerase specialized sigma24 family protein